MTIEESSSFPYFVTVFKGLFLMIPSDTVIFNSHEWIQIEYGVSRRYTTLIYGPCMVVIVLFTGVYDRRYHGSEFTSKTLLCD